MSLGLETFPGAAEFLRMVQPALEANEAANNLMLGLALRLEGFPERILAAPFYGVVRHGAEPQVAALMTPPHNLIVYAGKMADSAAAFELLARGLFAGGWPVPGVLGPNTPALAFAHTWQALTGETFTLVVRERVYELRRVIPPPAPPGRMRPAEADDLELVSRWIQDFHHEATPGEPVSFDELRENSRLKIADRDLYLWEDGEPVALAGRNRPTPNGYCIGPVYTPPERRRKGYATALTAALSQLLLDSGKRFTALFTDLSNPTSNSIYQKIGYHPVCDFDQYRFGR